MIRRTKVSIRAKGAAERRRLQREQDDRPDVEQTTEQDTDKHESAREVREGYGQDVVVLDPKRQRFELLNPKQSLVAVVAAIRKGGGAATTWQRLLLNGVFGLPEPRDRAAAGELLEAVFEVASRPEYQFAERTLRLPYAGGTVQPARLRAEVLKEIRRIRSRRRREGLIRSPRRIFAKAFGSRAEDPVVVMSRQRLEEQRHRFIAELREGAPPAVQQIISLKLEKDLSTAEACRQVGVSRVTFESWLNSVQRRYGVVKKTKSLASRRPNAS